MSENDSKSPPPFTCTQIVVGYLTCIGFLWLVMVVLFVNMDGPRLCPRRWTAEMEPFYAFYIDACCSMHNRWKAIVDWISRTGTKQQDNNKEEVPCAVLRIAGNFLCIFDALSLVPSYVGMIAGCPIDLVVGSPAFDDTCHGFSWSCLSFISPYMKPIYCDSSAK
jgi:hypothetical protein